MELVSSSIFGSAWLDCHGMRQELASPSLTITSKSNELNINHQRRSAHYHPSIWEPKTIESLSTPYTYEFYATRLEELKRNTATQLKSTRDPCLKLKLVDSMQRLGVAYHFGEEIEEVVDDLAHLETSYDLYATALRFRLLRQHSRLVSSDVFDKFRSTEGRFMDSLRHDLGGILSLYEASHLAMEGEDDLEEAKNFSAKHLKSSIGKLETSLAEQVQLSMDIPLHWRTPRVEARKFIDIYQRDNTRSSVLLELAKLDFNLVQSVYQTELKELSRWWTDLGFKEKLSFSRDRLVENYLWATGIICEPHFSRCRKGLTKFVCILTAIDDIYDVYGSLDELERFTNAVYRWDVKAIGDLPEYMKICYLAMLNFAHEMSTDILKDAGINILPYIKKEWATLCSSYLVEARWFSIKYTPTVEEYLQNGCTSVGGHAAMVHAYFLTGCTIKDNWLDCLKHGSEHIHWSSLITRLSDDLGTSKAEIQRGDVAKSIQCYMTEESMSEEEARDHIKSLITDSWKKMNGESVKDSIPKAIVNMSMNMARTAQCIFQHGDGIGTSTGVTEDRLTSLLVNPIPINQKQVY
uniref:Terpene synthase 4 n=1 Tax=Paeonia delavayi TaxID=40707 RepID=A0A9E8GE34_9MAGN|nr:terpene synthase 4 [Paeonia delavayi]